MATKLKAGTHTVELTVRRGTDPRKAARRVADMHRARNRIIDEHNRRILGVVPPETDFVDGKQGVPFEMVRLDGGTILTRYETLAEVLQWIEFQLISNSPYLTGAYAGSHKLYADYDETDPSNPAPAETYTFISTLPYSRKIERGQSRQAPEGVYEGVAAIARSRWGHFAEIRFTYDAVFNATIQDYASAARSGRAARAEHVANRFPAIRIRYK